ncbi:MAG: AlkA N-terminal domain-containing protein, partial [Microbacteriaceae bacterium]
GGTAGTGPDPGAPQAAPPGVISLRLPARPPFDGAGLMRYLAAHAAPGIEAGDAGRHARALRLPAGVAEVEAVLDGDGVRVEARLASLGDLPPLVARLRRLFDLDADAAAIDAALAADPALAPLVAACPGIRLPGSVDAFETLVRTMLGQQVSVAAASAVVARLVREASADPRLFPSPAELAERGPAVLRGPARRSAAIVAIAERVADGRLRLDLGRSVAELRAELEAQPGIGPWTAGHVAMRVLGAPDVLLESDLALRAGARRLGLPDSPRGIRERASAWAPWRSYAGMHLWRAPTMIG